MHILHSVLDSDGGLREWVSKLSDMTAGNPLKHAILLDLNPFWALAYHLENAGLRSDTFGIWWVLDRPISSGGALDFTRRYEIAEAHTERAAGGRSLSKNFSPFLLRIYAAPILRPDAELFDARRQLVNAAREMPLLTVVETHEPAQLLAAPGDEVSSGNSRGTLGGFLKDRTGGHTYGVTCGHVLSAGAAHVNGNVLGSVAHVAKPRILPAGTSCGVSCPTMTSLDVCLVDVPPAAASNVAAAVAALIAPGDIVEMNGASSGKLRYQIGPAVVEHLLGGACWDRLVQFYAPVSNGILPVPVHVAMSPPPAEGDSGAWLLRGRKEWAGMVIAGDALHGYAHAATTVLAKSNSAFGTNMVLA